MDDRKRDLIVSRSAYGYLICITMMFFVATLFGKAYGQILVLTIFPIYAMYYLVMYIIVCRGYQDKWRRISAFGFGGHRTLAGALYHLSKVVLVIILLFVFR